MNTPPPTLRTLGAMAIIVALILVWAALVASLASFVGQWPVLVQALFYLVAGLAWILPLRPVLRWAVTGRWGKGDPIA